MILFKFKSFKNLQFKFFKKCKIKLYTICIQIKFFKQRLKILDEK